MEMDELNEHPCMQPLVAAMRHFCQMCGGVSDKVSTSFLLVAPISAVVVAYRWQDVA